MEPKFLKKRNVSNLQNLEIQSKAKIWNSQTKYNIPEQLNPAVLNDTCPIIQHKWKTLAVHMAIHG